jgi:predicted outer membrane protein
MLRKGLTAIFVIGITGAAFAAPPPSGQADPSKKAADTEKTQAKPGAGLNVLHAVAQWSIDLSKLADTNAKSSLVKDYAREMAATNAEKDAKLVTIAKKQGIELSPLNPQTEDGRSILDRMKAEKVLLRSLHGDAFDKEYMTLVTNTQQSIIHYLQTQKASAQDEDVKAFLGDMETAVQARLQKAQDIMAQVYGDSV